MDPSAKATSFLTEEYCIKQLADNLRVEQPQVTVIIYLLNHTLKNIFYILHKSVYFNVLITDQYRQNLGNMKTYLLNRMSFVPDKMKQTL